MLYKKYNYVLKFHEKKRDYDIAKEVDSLAVKAGELYANGKISKWRFNTIINGSYSL
jgi:hypothetical protein